jgi:transposase
METRGRKRRSRQSDLDAAVEAVLAGASYRSAEALTGVPSSTVRDYVSRGGFVRRRVPRDGPKRVVDGVKVSTLTPNLGDERGAMPRERKRRPGSLSASEREEIRVGIEVGASDEAIASRIGRHRSTIWREIAANGGRGRYRAAAAEERAARFARRPKDPWTEERPWLWGGGPGTAAHQEVVARADRPPVPQGAPRPARVVGVARGHLPGGLRPGEGRAAKGAHRLPALGPGSEASSLASLLWT